MGKLAKFSINSLWFYSGRTLLIVAIFWSAVFSSGLTSPVYASPLLSPQGLTTSPPVGPKLDTSKDPADEVPTPTQSPVNRTGQPRRTSLTGNPVTFTNTGSVSIPSSGAATPYPTSINVSGIVSNITGLTVSLYNFSHTYPSDVDILLVGPGGQKTVLMSDRGNGTTISGVNLTFDDTASNSLTASPITSGTYKPSDDSGSTATDSFNTPAPTGPYSVTLTVFDGLDPNGTWKLYVVDDAAGDSGQIAGGWAITFYTIDQPIMLASAGNNQNAAVNTSFPLQLQVTVRNSLIDPAVGTVVTFTTPLSGASGLFAGGSTIYTATTNAQGIATAAILTANTTLGSYVVTATTASASNAITFALTNLVGPAASVEASAGSGQTVNVTVAFGTNLVARVADSYNNPIASQTVTFTAPASGASGTFANNTTVYKATTNASGLLTATVFTANNIAGSYTVTASVANVITPANFALTNTPASPIQFESSSYSVSEGAGTAVITLTRSGDNSSSVSAAVLPTELTASANDYAALLPGFSGGLDSSFISGTGFNGNVNDIVLQPDGKILVVGQFTAYNGTTRNHIVRLNSDGSLDTSFDPGTGADTDAGRLTLQPDGKILISGGFTSYNGVSRNRIARLNADGSLDTSFDPGTGGNAEIGPIALQSDGKIVIGGTFTSYNGVSRNRIARLNTDGSLDTNFNIGTGANEIVWDLVIQPSDDKTILAGRFTSYNGVSRNRIARLNTDGSLDTSFDPGTGANQGLDIWRLTLQPNGKVLIGGDFSAFNGVNRTRIARLNSDGSLDTSFNPGVSANNGVRPMVVQPDGKILTSGDFTSYANVSRNHLTRLNSDGSLDTTFDIGTGANDFVGAIAVLTNGKVLIGGRFSSYNGTTISRIARLGTWPVTWAAGDSSPKTITVGIVDDNLVEPDEQLLLTLSSTSNGATVGSPASTTLTILNNDIGVVGINATAGSGQSTPVSTPFPVKLVASVVDGANNPVSGQLVNFVAPGSGASGVFTNATNTYSGLTDSSGQVTTTVFTANALAGSYSVTATISGLNLIAYFDLTNLAGPPVSFTVVSGNYQAAPINSPFNNSLIVEARDIANNPVSGQTVSFTVPAIGASGNFSPGQSVFTDVTNSSGRVVINNFIANSLVGRYAITATLSNFITPTLITLTNQTGFTANLVYGQAGSFSTGTANKGGISATSLSNPVGAALDSSGGLYLADTANSRVLYYPAGSVTATRVYGQSSFVTNTVNSGGITANSLANPASTLLDSSGGLYIADSGNNRVLYYSAGSTTASRIYGQSSFVTNTANSGGITANSLYSPDFMVLDSANGLYVSDYSNHRVLYYPVGSTTANRVYGQSSFITNTANSGGITADSLFNPEGLVLDSSGGLYIADSGNNRVLYYPVGSTTASRVYGQPNFGSNTLNNGGLSANSLNIPIGLALDNSGGLYVADYGNHRVLYLAKDGDTTADRVYGQLGSFTTQIVNKGGISAASLRLPVSLLLDNAGTLYISDLNNNRLLAYPNQAVGSLQFSSASYSQNEGSNLVVTVTRSGGSTLGAVAAVSVTNLTASASDYSFTPSLLTWADGDSSPKTITITLNADASAEPAESFVLNLSTYNGGINLGSPPSSTITILDNACNPLLVSSSADDGSCGTLRTALATASSSSSKLVTITLAAGSVITLSQGLTLTSGVALTATAGCVIGTGPAITILGSGSNSGSGLTLTSNNQVYGLWVKGFSNKQITALAGGSNRLTCLKATNT